MYSQFTKTWSRYWQQAILEKKPGFFFAFLRLFCSFLSLPFWLVISLRRYFYENGLLTVHHLRTRVISVGNITLGGTGKTPVVSLLARHLIHRGLRVVILTRGYGRRSSQMKILTGGDGHWEEVGDEPVMLSRSLPKIPIVVSRDRVEAGRVAMERFHPDVIILDDGMQHLRLARDLELIVIDAICPFGNERLFPAGTLREKLLALKRANLFFLSRVNQSFLTEELVRWLHIYHPEAVLALGAFQPHILRNLHTGQKHPLQSLRNHSVVAISGIGNPDSLDKSLQELGARLVGSLRFPDHYPYRSQDLNNIFQLALQSQADFIVTTEKDAIRFPPLSDTRIPFVSLGIEIEMISGQKDLWKLVEGGL